MHFGLHLWSQGEVGLQQYLAKLTLKAPFYQ